MVAMRTGFLAFMTCTAVLGPADSVAQVSRDHRIDLVLRLLPHSARPLATLVFRDSEGDRVLRNGTSDFVCVSDLTRPRRLSSTCHHRALEEQLRIEREVSSAGLRGAEFRAQVCRRVESEFGPVPAGSMEITGSVGVGADGSLDSAMTVYHLVYLPGATTESIGVVDSDPGDGKPYLHNPGGCGAHVMWSEVRKVEIQ